MVVWVAKSGFVPALGLYVAEGQEIKATKEIEALLVKNKQAIKPTTSKDGETK